MRKTLLAFIFASGWVFAEDRATATGKVTDAAGKLLEHATVFVYEGHVKKGYGVYCPTCWADCGKHAATDPDGNFTIAGLNPDLKFKLMVVREGYTSAFVDQVDPANGAAQPASLKARPPIEDTSQGSRTRGGRPGQAGEGCRHRVGGRRISRSRRRDWTPVRRTGRLDRLHRGH
jgi:hypothetical protein